jgi:glycosyltransferase involved in cell wall biosynthesis
LLKAMKNVLLNDLDSMGRYNRSRAENYSWRNIAQMTLDVYTKSGVNRQEG